MQTDSATAVTAEAEPSEALAAETETETETVECSDCGAKVEADAEKCPECGEPIPSAEADDEATTAAATEIDAPVVDERPDANGGEAQIEQPEPQTDASKTRWTAVLVVEDKLTEDGRYIAPGATSWRDLPLSLMAMTETQDGHNGAVLCGRIDEIYREGNLIMGGGVFDDGEFGQEIARLVSDQTLRGNSVDLAILSFEVAPRADFDENGKRVRETDEEVDPLEAMFGGDDVVFVISDCVIGCSTVCPFPAFADAEISVTASAMVWEYRTPSRMLVVRKDEPEVVEATHAPIESEFAREQDAAIVAAGIPANPPAEWFADPKLDEPTPLTIDEEGRIFGHAAVWGTCHIGLPDVCTTAPHSRTNYAYYLLGEVETAEGSHVATGRVTLGTGHAAKHLGRQAAAEHYDNTGTVVADVNAGEDRHGIWIAGALRPGVTEERVREFRGSVLSGDWRNVNGNLELVGILAVNVPGFPVPRTRALVAAGTDGEPEVLALVAAAVLDPRKIDLSDGDRAKLAALGLAAEGGYAALADAAARD